MYSHVTPETYANNLRIIRFCGCTCAKGFRVLPFLLPTNTTQITGCIFRIFRQFRVEISCSCVFMMISHHFQDILLLYDGVKHKNVNSTSFTTLSLIFAPLTYNVFHIAYLLYEWKSIIFWIMPTKFQTSNWRLTSFQRHSTSKRHVKWRRCANWILSAHHNDLFFFLIFWRCFLGLWKYHPLLRQTMFQLFVFFYIFPATFCKYSS